MKTTRPMLGKAMPGLGQVRQRMQERMGQPGASQKRAAPVGAAVGAVKRTAMPVKKRFG